MSYDVVAIRRVDDKKVEYTIACSCMPSACVAGEGEIALADATFNHIDGVVITEWDGDVFFFDTTTNKLRLWCAGEVGLLPPMEDPTPDDPIYIPFRKLVNLFTNHWPSLGEIADACSFE